MTREIAIIGFEVANILLSSGFELVSIKEGKLVVVYYFKDSPELDDFLINLL